MDKTTIIAELERLGISYPPTATKADLQALLDAANLEATPDTADAVPLVPNLSGLFRAAPTRLQQANFEGTVIGSQIESRMTSFRVSREGGWWIGTFTFPGYGTVQAVIGARSESTMQDLMTLKTGSLVLTYTGQTSLPTREGGTIMVPKFRVEF